MMTSNALSNRWTVRTKENGYIWTGPLHARYEVNFSTISDDYTPSETSAEELLKIWIHHVLKKQPDGLLSIYWSVESEEQGKSEAMPFQHDDTQPNFLTYYDWPIHADTKEPLNWLSIPVKDLGWRPGHSNKGGFIQQATGWKPSILQPSVHLTMLSDTRRNQ